MRSEEMLDLILKQNPELKDTAFLLIVAKTLQKIGKEIEQFVQIGGLT